jgi:heat-inducible transcriptional repressor
MLSERNKRVLCAVVQSYINYPDPVGSRVVTKRYPFGLSPATIRNIMADLEEMGFLAQPHTSAGRVPTDAGYRFFVECLFAGESIYSNIELLQGIQRKLESLRNDMDLLLSETTKNLSLLSHYLGVAMSPGSDSTTMKRINLIKYGRDRVAVVIMTGEGQVRNKVVIVDSELSQKDLYRIMAYLNGEFSGYTFDEIRLKIVREMSREKSYADSLIARAMKICSDAIDLPGSELFLSGLSEVLELPDFSDLKKIRELSKAIEDKHMIMKLLNGLTEQDEGVKVIIGSENEVEGLRKLSIVVSPCTENGRKIGVVGIIGPTRMNYARSIYIVENTARMISRMLAGR